jgi:endonuclease/exonuclease/phosphatase family metal-dependent hydrolase
MGAMKIQKKISLLSFNTLGTPFFAPYITRRYRKIAQHIADGDFDIVCLQEIFTYYHFSLFQKTLKEFPYTIFQKNPFGPRGGLVIFSKIPLTDPKFRSFSYPKNAFVPLYTKLAQQGILSAEIKELSLRIATTHFSSDTVHELTPANKLYNLIHSQSLQAAEFVNSTKNSESLILAGDFNIAKQSLLYKEFVTSTKVVDTFGKDTTPTYLPDRVSYFYRSPAGRPDNIYIKSSRRNIKILKTGYEFTKLEKFSNNKESYLSDHIGLHCILEVNK